MYNNFRISFSPISLLFIFIIVLCVKNSYEQQIYILVTEENFAFLILLIIFLNLMQHFKLPLSVNELIYVRVIVTTRFGIYLDIVTNIEKTCSKDLNKT